jgi:protein-L-isoaspartate(D-aspartate) O-methyltransferase
MALWPTRKPDFQKARAEMVGLLARRGIKDPNVLEAMAKIHRHLFVPPHLQDEAYADYPLAIGEGQTISQPYIVALMTEALELDSQSRVLEIGTGSGYQAAILAELAAEVYTVERITSLAQKAQGLLEELGYTNVKIKVGDGTLGWPECSPYHGIVVTAAAPSIPPPLIEQLEVGGRLVIPVGGSYSQDLLKAVKLDLQGNYSTHSLGGCVFVKLYGKYGWQERG